MDMADAINLFTGMSAAQAHRAGCMCPKCKGEKVGGKITTKMKSAKIKISKPASKKQFEDKVKELHEKMVINLDPKKKKTVEAGGPGSGRHSTGGTKTKPELPSKKNNYGYHDKPNWRSKANVSVLKQNGWQESKDNGRAKTFTHPDQRGHKIHVSNNGPWQHEKAGMTEGNGSHDSELSSHLSKAFNQNKAGRY